MRLAVVVLFGALTIGCPAHNRLASPQLVSQAEAFPAEADGGAVYILREDAFVGSGLEITAHVDDMSIGDMAGGDYFRVVLPPGPHVIQGGEGRGVEVAVEKGGNHFVMLSTNELARIMGDAEGREAVLDSRMLEAGKPMPRSGAHAVRKSDGDTVQASAAGSSGVRVQLMAAGKDVKKIAVPTVSGIDLPRQHLDVLSDAALSSASRVPPFEVVGASDIEAMLGFEKQKELLGCEDTSCYAEIGGALGVDAILAVKLGKLGDTYRLSASCIDIRSSKSLVRGDVSLQGSPDALLPATEELVTAVLQALSKS